MSRAAGGMHKDKVFQRDAVVRQSEVNKAKVRWHLRWAINVPLYRCWVVAADMRAPAHVRHMVCMQ